MRRTLKFLALSTLLVAAACSDPTGSISATDTTASADEGECLAAGGYLGSGNVVPCS